MLSQVEQGWLNQFQACDVNKTAERDYYFAGMKSCQYLRKQLSDILTRDKY